jgi:hypothetical protein
MAIEMTMIELVCIAEKAVIAGSRTAFIPARQFVAGDLVEMEKPQRGPRQFRDGTRLLDQPFPDADAALGGLPENYAPVPFSADPLDRDFLLFDLVLDLNSPAQRVGKRRQEILIRLLRSNPQ